MSAAELIRVLRHGAEGDVLPWSVQAEASAQFQIGFAEVEKIALESGLLPGRYRRNRETVSIEEQLRLFRSRAVVIGCGGLGGYLIEELARLGVGTLVMIDPDVFEEHNLNRQLFSSPAVLGKAKVECAIQRVLEINPAVTAIGHRVAFAAENASRLLGGADVVADALDNVLVRRQLAKACRELRMPLVHGAIAGWYGQVATQLPDGDLSPFLNGSPEGKGIEKTLGNPSFTPAVVASLEAAEVCKVLLGKGGLLSKRVLFLNLLEMEMDQIRYE